MSNWKASVVPPQFCPACGATADRVSSPNGLGPEQGDLTICIHCATILIVDADMTRRIPKAEELEGIWAVAPPRYKDDMVRAQTIIKQFPAPKQKQTRQ